MTDPSRDDHPSRDARFRAKKGHIWRGVGVSAEARPVDPPMAGCREAEGFPDAGRCGRKNRQEHDLDVARQHPGPVHRGQSGSPGSRPAPANLRAPRQRTSPATTADQPTRQLPSRRAEPTRRTPVGFTPRSRCGRRSTACGTCPRDRRAYTCGRRSNRAVPG